jgi:GTPase
VAVIGNVDSGKSTLVGVLTRGVLDDGRGLARSKVSVSVGWRVRGGGQQRRGRRRREQANG